MTPTPATAPNPITAAKTLRCSLATAEYAGMGRMVMRISPQSVLYLSEAACPEAMDVMFEAWMPKDSISVPTQGEKIASCKPARAFRQVETHLVPAIAFHDRSDGRIRMTHAACIDPRSGDLFIWSRDYFPRARAGAAAFDQSIMLDDAIDQNFPLPETSDLDDIARDLLLG
jgi:hypothetical protein